jgi:hypothetical protein
MTNDSNTGSYNQCNVTTQTCRATYSDNYVQNCQQAHAFRLLFSNHYTHKTLVTNALKDRQQGMALRSACIGILVRFERLHTGVVRDSALWHVTPCHWTSGSLRTAIHNLQHAMRMRHVVIYALPRVNNIFRIIPRTARLWKTVTEHNMCVLDFSRQ